MLSDISLILREYGFKALALVIALMFMHKRYMFKSLLSPKYTPKLDRDKLRAHPMFIDINHVLEVGLKTSKFSQNIIKDELYRDLLRILYKSVKESNDWLVDNLDDGMTSQEWKMVTYDTHFKSLKLFEASCIENGIPSKAIRVFLHKYSNINTIIKESIDYGAVMASKFNVMISTRYYLDTANTCLGLLRADVEKFEIINGELDGMEYKGNRL